MIIIRRSHGAIEQNVRILLPLSVCLMIEETRLKNVRAIIVDVVEKRFVVSSNRLESFVENFILQFHFYLDQCCSAKQKDIAIVA